MGRHAQTYDTETVEVAIKRLEELSVRPTKEQSMTTSDAIMKLKPAIKCLQQKGYTLQEILAELRESGINIGLTTIRTAVSKSKRKIQTREDRKTPENLVTKAAQGKESATLVTKTDGKMSATPSRAPALQDPDEK